LSDELKQNADRGRMSLPRDPLQSNQAAPMDDAEQQMRKALGLSGDAPRPRPEGERTEPTNRLGAGFLQGAHRRRFVQDGEVPVTVVRRDVPDAGHHGTGQTPPTSSRLQRVEAALSAETSARESAEKQLHEARAALQALQTKIGHNDLAKEEAVAVSKRQAEEIVSVKEELAAANERLREIEAHTHDADTELEALRAELAEERRGRKLAERLLREATEEAPVDVPPVPAQIERIPARRGRPPAVRAPVEVEEGEPVKWWLLPAKTVAKRR
jgi:hypothetical protein